MKNRAAWMFCLLLMTALMAWTPLRAEVHVTDVSVRPRWPWNGKVDITYSIECDEVDEEGNPKDVYVDFTGYDRDRDRTVRMKSLTGDGANAPVKAGGPYTVTWDAAKDEPGFNSAAFQAKVHAMAGLGTYMVVDLSGGLDAVSFPVHYSDIGPDLSNDICRTTELWLRKIPAGTFIMGSPEYEIGRDWFTDMAQHEVTISHSFYIGVFECTQRQWELIIGDNPGEPKGDYRPVERYSYERIRGTVATGGAGWPMYGHVVDADSFMGTIRAKTGLLFDLPTEAQWEYACRAGTTTALNSGKNLKNRKGVDPNLNVIARYRYNIDDGKGIEGSSRAKVGSYLPNAWGLFDMHGNVCEWCLDWMGADRFSTQSEKDPVGPLSGTERIRRGGGSYWSYDDPEVCRSAARAGDPPSYADGDNGFRVVCIPVF